MFGRYPPENKLKYAIKRRGEDSQIKMLIKPELIKPEKQLHEL